MKFDFSKSRTQDFRNKLQMDKFDIINKNILYITHEVDQIKKVCNQILNSMNLQKQVDEYFEDRQPEEDREPD